jgi:formylglycine-generating enzyme required for sulfatase activity
MLPAVVQAMTIKTVWVGNPGNAGEQSRFEYDDLKYYGGVDYAYRIGKYEVSNTEYTDFLNAVDPNGANPHDLYNSNMGSHYQSGITYTAGNPEGLKYATKPGRGDWPVNFISFWDACRFANWLHNGQGSGDTETGVYTLTSDGIANNTVTRNPGWLWAVCSEDEWYKAAYYDGGSNAYYDYPTGSDTAPAAENPPGTDLVNGSANYDQAMRAFTNVGAYKTKPSDSPYGTHDQGGNIWEWNEAIIMTSERGFRGGSWYDGERSMRASTRGDYPATNEFHWLGFRVSEIPEPSGITLLVCGLVAGLVWWSRCAG